MAQSNDSGAADISIEQKITNHLSQALEAESSEEKNFYIRSALQLCVASEVGAER